MPDKILNLVNEIVTNAENRRVARLVIQNDFANGNKIVLEGKELISFGSYSYLGLETDCRLKQAAIEGIQNFGLQYPSSRVYTSLPAYVELEMLFQQIFGAPVVLTTSLSLGHVGVLPVIVSKEDILILDQHVHSSVQDAAQRLKAKSIQLKIVRHNDLKALEAMIQEFSHRYSRVWYAIDSIYSMYGDVAPLEELYQLIQKYPSFHLYIDDAHGVSSYGKNGSGWVLEHIPLHDRIILTTGMAKAFGTMGGIFVIKNPEMYERVKNCTGSLIFSGGHPVPILSASIASARIHLSNEISSRQSELQGKLLYCHELLKKKGIPDISDPRTPIFFIALGLLKVGYNMVRRMIDDGFYVNLASFPAVSESRTGVRFTVTVNHSIDDIELLVDALAKNYPLALYDENVSTEDVRKAFRKVPCFPENAIDICVNNKLSELKIVHSNTISSIDTIKWDEEFKDSPLIRSNFLRQLEEVFSGNQNKEDNWKFHYFEVFNSNSERILSTFFTQIISKDDLLSLVHVSREIEKTRLTDKYFFTSETLMMGSLVTEGNHLNINRKNPSWRDALSLLLREIENLKDKENINAVILRDFANDRELFSCLSDESYLKIELPDSHRIVDLNWGDVHEYTEQFRKHRRRYLKKIVIENEGEFKVQIVQDPDESKVEEYWQLYLNVNRKSLEINNFDLPFAFFTKVLSSEGWEIIELIHKATSEIAAIMICNNCGHTYTPLLVGMNYELLQSNCYPQIIWQTILRGKELKADLIPLGFTASQIKRKFGATTEEKYGFVKMKDNFSLQLMNLLH